MSIIDNVFTLTFLCSMPGSINEACKTNFDLSRSPLLAEVVGDGKKDLKENLSLRTNKYYSLDNQVRYIRAIIDKLRNKKAFSPLETKFLESNVFKNLPPQTVALLEAEGVLEHNSYIIRDGKGNYFINMKTISANQSKREESALPLDPERLKLIFSTSIDNEGLFTDDLVPKVLQEIGIKTVEDLICLDLDTIWKIVTRGKIVFDQVFAKVKELFDDDGLRF